MNPVEFLGRIFEAYRQYNDMTPEDPNNGKMTFITQGALHPDKTANNGWYTRNACVSLD